MSQTERILREGLLKFMNFSRKLMPGLLRVGCAFGDSFLDVTKAIGDDLLEFPRLVFNIEEVLHVKDGLDILNSQLRGLERSAGGIQSYLVNLSDVTFHSPVVRPLKLI